MTTGQFNVKYSEYLDEGHYGMDINDERVIKFLDKEFTEEIEHDPNFKYQQIKLKWNMTRIYSSSEKNYFWENEIDKILGNGTEPTIGYNK